VVIETACRHAFPLRYADRVAITGWISEYARRLVIRYGVQTLSRGRRAAHGHTAIATLDTEGRLRLETPPEIIARIRAGSGRNDLPTEASMQTPAQTPHR